MYLIIHVFGAGARGFSLRPEQCEADGLIKIPGGTEFDQLGFDFGSQNSDITV